MWKKINSVAWLVPVRGSNSSPPQLSLLDPWTSAPSCVLRTSVNVCLCGSVSVCECVSMCGCVYCSIAQCDKRSRCKVSLSLLPVKQQEWQQQADSVSVGFKECSATDIMLFVCVWSLLCFLLRIMPHCGVCGLFNHLYLAVLFLRGSFSVVLYIVLSCEDWFVLCSWLESSY